MTSFTWGETVRIKSGATPKNRIGSSLLASICGIREVETEIQAQEFGAPIGSKLYLVEFGDGESLELAENWLEPLAS